MQAAIPDRQDKVGIADGQRARQVNRIGSPQCMPLGQSTGLPFDCGAELYWPHSSPVPFPGLLCPGHVLIGQVVIAGRRSQGRAHLGVGQPARHGSVAAIPQLGGQVTPGFIDQEFHESAGIEVDESHAQRRCSPTRSDTGRAGRGRD